MRWVASGDLYTLDFMKLPTGVEDRGPLGVTYLKSYYSAVLDPESRKTSSWYSGAYFDRWSGDCPDDSPNQFTAEDVVALSFLSVPVKAEAALTILRWRAVEFSELLAEIGPDRDLAEEPAWLIGPEWPAWKLEKALRSITGIGPVSASKLIARKRPRLYPIYDRVINKVVGSGNRILEPLHARLSTDPACRSRLRELRDAAGLPGTISEIRIFDVLAWMEGKAQRLS